MAKPLQTTAISKNSPAAPQKEHRDDDSLKGTFASVMILGAFILLMWFGVFVLFLSRN